MPWRLRILGGAGLGSWQPAFFCASMPWRVSARSARWAEGLHERRGTCSGRGVLVHTRAGEARVSLVPKDLTPTYKETIGKGAGARRWQRPVYVDHKPPCNQACPAGENIQAWLSLAQAGDYEQAWRKYMEENPLPATHGRACYHPCESACNRQYLDQAVSIHSLDRFLGDLANDKGWTIAPGPPTGKRVLVVGAGPAGLSCAYHLRRFGHDVEIRDANPEPGGMMHYGIPAYRLPREGLDKEIARIEAMGVTIVRNSRVNDVLAEKAAGAFDAVFLGI